MKTVLKYISIFIYMFIVLYMANKMVEWQVLSKNYLYIIIILPILIIGVVILNRLFNKYGK